MKKIRIDKSGLEISQRSFKGFIKNGYSIFYTTFTVYADGIIDCWGETDIEGFKQKIKDGWIYLNPKEDDEIRIGDCGDTEFDIVVKSIHVFDNNTEEKILNTIQSIIDNLNGIDREEECIKGFKEWELNKNEHNRKILEEKYLKVPEQDRRFLLGDMDNKDIPIRIAIYGNEEVKKHTHFAVSNALVNSGCIDNIESETIKEAIRIKSEIFDNPDILE